jgi:hypothetical protein
MKNATILVYNFGVRLAHITHFPKAVALRELILMIPMDEAKHNSRLLRLPRPRNWVCSDTALVILPETKHQLLAL